MLAGALALGSSMALVSFVRWGRCWGSTAEERARRMTGDAYFLGTPRKRVVMTRAISIRAPPAVVWPWLAQMGRGAGWYSYDRLDNAGKPSARHLVSWIPEPRAGDASAIGYLRRVEPGRELVWWSDGERFVGATARLAVDVLLLPEHGGSRVVIRMSADATGPTAALAMTAFEFIDTVMALRQLQGLKERAERFGLRRHDPEQPETGRRTQYQLNDVVYADGQRTGGIDPEHIERWRRAAIDAHVLAPPG